MKKRLVAFVLVVVVITIATLFIQRKDEEETSQPEQPVSALQMTESNTQNTPQTDNSMEYSAMWISYLEWESIDFSSQQSFTADISEMIANCVNLGINRLIVQVRPFGDALYHSEIFPTSHLITGRQGEELPYDPLQIIVNGAHAAGLQIDAWINPYRVQLNREKPDFLCEENPAVRWMEQPATSNYVKEASGGLYYNPGEPEVRQLILDGVQELLDGYAVDGIVFDDYFYPTTDSEFDKETFRLYGAGDSLEEWRKQNVNTLVRSVYSLIKKKTPECSFGISPAGNIMNNLSLQYSDVVTWLSEPGYVDYLAPQLYWGFDYRTKSGSDAFAFENILSEWFNLPICDEVKLYPVLGAYRIGAGDESSVESEEWQSGENLARMLQLLNEKTDGFSLYRYDYLYHNTKYTTLAAKEIAALQKLLIQPIQETASP